MCTGDQGAGYRRPAGTAEAATLSKGKAANDSRAGRRSPIVLHLDPYQERYTVGHLRMYIQHLIYMGKAQCA